ncbi:MAG: aminodeoxychorismate/anthranilate synthase component II [Nitrososphaerota archaeon]|nr:aminodeoxychorismate/anthranilate synthase component II [Candidatus Calditenuaceae archaeon]MDW8072623.1 aminodeoxychorismate/anthranilate synthase component II [Nitrososphaerota archaeon]
MKVLVIDNLDSFVYNIVQYLGELGVHPLVFRNNKLTLEEAIKLDPDAIVISPGPGHPADRRFFGVSGDVIKVLGSERPVLGVCLGHQGIVCVFGGRVERASKLMHGKVSMIRHSGSGIFEGVKNPLRVARYHSLAVKPPLPESLEITAVALDDGEIMALEHRAHPIFGVQFHPESIMTEQGHKILENFLKTAKK